MEETHRQQVFAAAYALAQLGNGHTHLRMEVLPDVYKIFKHIADPVRVPAIHALQVEVAFQSFNLLLPL